MSQEHMERCLAAWRKNTVPKAPGEFDNLIPLPLESNIPLLGLVTWNADLIRPAFQVQAVVPIDQKYQKFYCLTLELESRVYYRIKRFMRTRYGIKHRKDIVCLDAKHSTPTRAPEPTADLQKMFTPTLVHNAK